MSDNENIIEAEAQEVVQEAAQEPGANEGVSLGDLANVVNIIDVATERGAFRGPELEGIGATRRKIVNLLNEAQAQQQVEPTE